MARSFNGISNQITHNGPAFGSAGTISVVVKKDVADSETGWRYVYDSTTRHLFYKRGGSSEGPNTYGVYLNGTLIWDDATAVPNVMLGFDFQVVTITWDNSDPSVKERIYRNGVQLATANIAVTAGTAASLFMGTRFNGVEPWSGAMAEMAVWNRKLSADEVASIGKSFSPKFFLRGLIHHSPYYGKDSPEPELMNGKNGTVNGATAIAHPPIILPGRPQIITTPSVVVAGQPIIKRRATIPFLGGSLRQRAF
jgi:hypothetical protein